MVKTLSIECPHCKNTFDVLLSNNASMVVLNCPMCLTPLIHYKTRCFVLNKNQIDKIRKSRQDTTVLKILHSISKEKSGACCSHNGAGVLHAGASGERYVTRPTELFSCTHSITKDDIINLRIELEMCPDSKQFIDKL
jgi:hypothetical protein